MPREEVSNPTLARSTLCRASAGKRALFPTSLFPDLYPDSRVQNHQAQNARKCFRCLKHQPQAINFDPGDLVHAERRSVKPRVRAVLNIAPSERRE